MIYYTSAFLFSSLTIDSNWSYYALKYSQTNQRGYSGMKDFRSRRLRDHSTGLATLVSEGCKISGLITGSGEFLINGEIDGDCDLAGTVTVAKNGLWNGSIKADNVIIAGHVEGDVVAARNVEIIATARIKGTVTGEAIAVAEGAIVDGVMTTTGPGDPQEFVEKRAES